jgi:predicted nucleic acid-binding protein
MTVLDASAVIELLLGSERGHAIAARIAEPSLALHIPHLADLEVAQALRRYVRDGDLDARRAEEALADLRSLDVERHAHEPLLDRVWALRTNLTAYDAVYLALAEALDTSVLTCDARLSRSPVAAGRVDLIS